MTQGLVQERVANALQGALSDAKAKGQLKMESWPAVTLDAPKRPEWGDLATTVAMSLAASEKRAPQDIAQIIADHLLTRDQLFERVEIVRPGFTLFQRGNRGADAGEPAHAGNSLKARIIAPNAPLAQARR